MRKVWICSPVLLLGGTEMHMLALGRILVDGGASVRVIAYHETDPEIRRLFVEAGMEVETLQWPRPTGVRGYLRLLFRLRKFFRQGQPSVIHVQYLAPGLIPILAARLARVPVVFGTVHIAGSVAYGRKAQSLLRIAARFCTTFFCVSEGVERFWFGESAVLDPLHIPSDRRHFTIYNTVDAHAIATAARSVNRSCLRGELGLPPDAPVVGFLGRLTFQKGVPILLAAMVEVLCDVPEAWLLVVGDGPERCNLQAEASRLGISERTVWLGAQPPARVAELLGVMNVFAVPSLYEGFGLMAAEALAAGVPVVASRIEGLTEVVQDGECGLLVPPGDSPALARGLLQIVKDPNLSQTLAERGRIWVGDAFSKKRFSESWAGVYRYHLSSVPLELKN